MRIPVLERLSTRLTLQYCDAHTFIPSAAGTSSKTSACRNLVDLHGRVELLYLNAVRV